MHARHAGARGPAVVLVHGVGVSGRHLVPAAELLARRCRVWIPDLPGFGRSQDPGRLLGLASLALPEQPVTPEPLGWEQASALIADHGGELD